MARTATHKDGMEALAVLVAGRKVVGTGMQDILAGRATADEVMAKVAEVVPAVMDDDAADAVASVEAFLAAQAPAVNEERDRAMARSLINGGRTAGRKETKVKQEAGPATVATRTARARKQSAKERLTSSPYVAHVLKMAGGELVVPQTTVDTLEEAAAKMRAAHATRAASKATPKVKAAKAPKAAMQPAPDGSRNCPGWPAWGVAAHVAPLADFGKDRACRTCRKTVGTRAKEAKAAGLANSAAWRAAQGTVAANAGPGRPELGPVVVVDGTAAQDAEIAALDATLAEAGVGTEAGQAALAAAAAEAAEARRAYDRERKARQRAAAKAAQS